MITSLTGESYQHNGTDGPQRPGIRGFVRLGDMAGLALVGRCAIITGASAGIGLATAHRLDAAGADLVLNAGYITGHTLDVNGGAWMG
jgi:hypothetical protein